MSTGAQQGGPATAGDGRRPIKSYVRRTTRLDETKQHAWDRYAGRWVLPFAEGPRETMVAPEATPLDLVSAFGRRAPLLVEIGSGAGESLVATAEARPDADLLAFEVYQPAVASTLSRISRAGVENVRVVVADAVEGLRLLLEPATVAELMVFFPDPWPKLKHRKRRLVDPAFADLVATRMVPGGLWHLATDWQDYADQMLRVLQAHPRFEAVHEGWAPRPATRVQTRFETKGLERGRVIRDLTFRCRG